MNINFRNLRADEVDVRSAGQKDGNKVALLLYQDARCAMNILDATLGCSAWQKEYYEAAGLLFCRIGIYDAETKQWLWKSDTGSKSNIEEEKGLASDAFKRAAVAWGIGRELYTAPRIVVELTDKDMYGGKVCQTFHVGQMEVKDGVITKLTILDKWNKVRFSYSEGLATSETDSKDMNEEGNTSHSDALRQFCSSIKEDDGTDLNQLKKFFSFYMQPSKTDASVCVADSLKDFNPQSRWETWISKSSKTAA